MKRFRALTILLQAAAVLSLIVESSSGYFSLDDTVMGNGGPFSASFCRDYQAAEVGSSSSEMPEILVAMLSKYTNSQEQAELHLTLGVIFNQRYGLVDHAKSIEHMTAVLRFPLPPTVLARVYLWRGNSFEQLKRNTDAARDYLTGLCLCLSYDLPKTIPELTGVNPYDIGGPTNSPEYLKAEALHRKQMEKRQKVLFDRIMLKYQHSFLAATQRIIESGILSKTELELLGQNIAQCEPVLTKLNALLNYSQPQQ